MSATNGLRLESMVVVDRCIVLFERKRRSKWRTLVCCGPRSHFFKAGSCRHAELVVASLRPEFKRLVRVRPFGALGS